MAASSLVFSSAACFSAGDVAVDQHRADDLAAAVANRPGGGGDDHARRLMLVADADLHRVDLLAAQRPADRQILDGIVRDAVRQVVPVDPHPLGQGQIDAPVTHDLAAGLVDQNHAPHRIDHGKP